MKALATAERARIRGADYGEQRETQKRRLKERGRDRERENEMER